jgi:hypothetical protein
MPTRVAQRGDTVQYRATSGETRNMLVLYKQEAAPPVPASSTSASGGTLAAATYSYRVSKVLFGVETLASTAKTQVTTGATSTVTVDWSAGVDARATSYKVYGRTGGTELLMATVAMPTTQFIDDGSGTPAGALPAASTALTLLNPYGAPLTNIAKATTNKGTNVYFAR